MKECDSDLKIIALTTYEEPEIMKQCMSSGASGCVLKHSAAKDLIEAVEEVLKGGTYLTSKIGSSK
jgi:DNA-binding NarL/FixJ family response regulator